MGLVQIVGYGAFILASAVLGLRLMLLWRRTHEVPELVLGTSFLAGGVFGYAAMFVASYQSAAGRPPSDVHLWTVAGAGGACAAALLIARGVQLIFRAGEAWVRWPVMALAVTMVVLLTVFATWPVDAVASRSRLLWATFMTASLSYTWSAWECFQLHGLLAKRARLGLASPLLADRARLWGFAFGSVVLMYWVPFVDYLVHDPTMAPRTWVSTVTSLFGLACAAAIWLGFFPPAFYRRRFEARSTGVAA
jgi:hypothetical protein